MHGSLVYSIKEANFAFDKNKDEVEQIGHSIHELVSEEEKLLFDDKNKILLFFEEKGVFFVLEKKDKQPKLYCLSSTLTDYDVEEMVSGFLELLAKKNLTIKHVNEVGLLFMEKLVFKAAKIDNTIFLLDFIGSIKRRENHSVLTHENNVEFVEIGCCDNFHALCFKQLLEKELYDKSDYQQKKLSNEQTFASIKESINKNLFAFQYDENVKFYGLKDLSKILDHAIEIVDNALTDSNLLNSYESKATYSITKVHSESSENLFWKGVNFLLESNFAITAIIVVALVAMYFIFSFTIALLFKVFVMFVLFRVLDEMCYAFLTEKNIYHEGKFLRL